MGTLGPVHPVTNSYPATERRFLPAIPSGFELGHREPLAVGLRRVAVEQFDVALEALASSGDVGETVHEVRKATKRLRAVLRLVRSELGEGRYQAENDLLRNTARLLAPVRDADILVLSVARIRRRFAAQLQPTAFEGLADRLAAHRERTHAGARDTEEWRRVVYAIRSSRARYTAWPVDDDAARAHGMQVIPHAFRSVAPGVRRTYARGRDEMREAARRPAAENFHAWRKRAKYLRHQMEILVPLWPEVISGLAASLDRLGDVLGEEHDLAELLRTIAARPDLCPDPVERSMLVALVQHRRAELQTAALGLGARIYAEPHNRFVGRVGEYWAAWDAPVPVGFGG